MMSKSERRPAESSAEHVEIRRFCGKRERECSQRSFAVESGAAEACAGKEVGYGFQV